MRRKIAIFVLVIVLIILDLWRIVLGHSYDTSGGALAKKLQEIQSLDLQNKLLHEQILERQSFAHIKAWADEQGYIPLPIVIHYQK